MTETVISMSLRNIDSKCHKFDDSFNSCAVYQHPHILPIISARATSRIEYLGSVDFDLNCAIASPCRNFNFNFSGGIRGGTTNFVLSP